MRLQQEVNKVFQDYIGERCLWSCTTLTNCQGINRTNLEPGLKHPKDPKQIRPLIQAISKI